MLHALTRRAAAVAAPIIVSGAPPTSRRDLSQARIRIQGMGRYRRRTVLGLVLAVTTVMVALGVHVTGSGSAGGSTQRASSGAGSCCGHRSWVPEPTGAAEGLSFGPPSGAGARRLGITYGPYLGRRCAPPGRRNCETVGIDVVFRHAATRVVAVAGAQKIHLRTPGKHDGVRYRDWVGTFTHAGFPRPARGAGGTVVYAPIELRVRFADGRRVSALLRHVPLFPGWG